MSAVAHYLEAGGIATTGISLVRENTMALRPPRFLWVSFPLGRPLGAPGDAAFQRRVVTAALALLDAPKGPVLEDFPEDVASAQVEQAACPVQFPGRSSGGGLWRQALAAEVALLRPWFEVSRQRRGRTTVGIADRPVEELAVWLGELLDGEPGAPLPGNAAGVLSLKRCLEDLKAFHTEAITAQPGAMPWREVRRLLWRESTLGAAMLALHDRLLETGDARLAAFTRVVVPRGALDD